MIFQIDKSRALESSGKFFRNGKLCYVIPQEKLGKVNELVIACQLKRDLKMEDETYRNDQIVLAHSRHHLQRLY